MIVRTLPCYLVFLWVCGIICCLFVGIGIRYWGYGWRRQHFMPGEEVILFTGQNHGVFCEKVMIQSSGYLTAKHLRVNDWNTFKNPETRSDKYDISLAFKHSDFKKYRLYPREWLDIRLCSEKGLMLYTASSSEAFIKLKSDLERGNPCQERPQENDQYCGKVIRAYSIPPAGMACNWLATGQDFNQAMNSYGWQRATFAATVATDVYVVVAGGHEENRGRNLLDIQSHKYTYLGGSSDVISECLQLSQCMFAMDFGSNQVVVVQVGTVNEELTQPVEIWTFCKSRDWFFVLLFCIIPLVLLSAISFCTARKFNPTHRLSYKNRR